MEMRNTCSVLRLPCLLLVALVLALSACDNKSGKKVVTENKTEVMTKTVQTVENDSVSLFVEDTSGRMQHTDKTSFSLKRSSSPKPAVRVKTSAVEKHPVLHPVPETKQEDNEVVVAVLDTTVKTKESRFQKSVDKKALQESVRLENDT